VLRSPTGEPVTVRDLKSKFAQQRARGAQNQITEEEEAMLLETLGRMRSRTSALSGKSQDSADESAEQHSVKSTSTMNSVIQATLTSSPSGRSTKRYSNNLFGSGRLRDYSYFRNAGAGLGRTRSARAASITPTETSISIQEVASLSDSVQPVTSDNSSIQSSIDYTTPNLLSPFAIPEEDVVQPPSTTDSSLIKRASMALADAIKELEETEDEVVMPRLPRPSPDPTSRQVEVTQPE
jgi:serine/arginine repetitive matrix protein 2